MAVVSDLFQQILSANVGKVFLRQKRFGTYAAIGNWNIDFSAGTISFAGSGTYPIQLLGSESYVSDTWRWGFDNNVAESVVADTHAFFAMVQSTSELHGGDLDLTEYVNGHNIASLAAALHPEPVCYYRCPYDNGAAFVLVKNLPAEVFAENAPFPVILEAFRSCTARMELDHHALLVGMFADNGVVFHENDTVMQYTDAQGTKGELRFDALHRVQNIQCSLSL